MWAALVGSATGAVAFMVMAGLEYGLDWLTDRVERGQARSE